MIDVDSLMKRVSLAKVIEELDELEAVRSKLPADVYDNALKILKGFELIGQENEPNPDGIKPGVLAPFLKIYNIEI